MRAIHVLRKYNPAQWGGTETALQRLFEGLTAQGVACVVYSPKLDSQPESDPLRDAGYPVHRFRAFVPVFGMPPSRKRQLISVGGNLLSFDLIFALMRERSPAIIHTHTLGRIGGIALTVARRRNVPLVITIHGGVLDLPSDMERSLNDPSPGGWEWGKFFGLLLRARKLISEADAILTCNETEARLLRRSYPNQRILVHPHGVPAEVYRQDCRQQALKAFPQIAGKQMLLCMGRIDPVKNQDWLIRQAPEIFARHPAAMLVFAGARTDESYAQQVQGAVAALGADRALLTGGLPPNDPRLIGLLQSAALLIVPSKSETFGLVILEAWAAGTLALSSRTSGACALVRHGHNGWIFDVDKPLSFHESLNQALSDPQLTAEIRRNGSNEVRENYSLPALASRMKKLYEELIREKHAIRDSSRR